MEKIKCGIVRDLLESYEEGLTTDTVAEMITDHLAECEGCQMVYRMKKEAYSAHRKEEALKEQGFRNKMLSYRYQVIGFMLGAGLVIAVLGVKILLQNVWMYLFW